ncbi:MAG TPA: UDP-3-O-(3-hydroxymyristoyl)glucosamine N-acyltransferase [Burkholderiaceae bacterium]|nr:UDP-3-O-(3-hydroxymyristoyl)glucosamine N-acyltransferase [Burkholderiaceae bacterium]
MPEVQLSDIVTRLGGELCGDPSTRIARIGPLQSATLDTISFLSNPRYQSQLAGTRAACVIVSAEMRDAAIARGAAIVVPDPYLYFARLTQFWADLERPKAVPGVHASAVLEEGAVVEPDASIGAMAFVGAGAYIGPKAIIGAQCHVGPQARVGAQTRLAPRVTVLDRCVIGARGILHSGVVIGADGFGFAPTEGRWEKIEQLGIVRIGDDVEIGANTCIDRGALDETVIEDGVKLDNLIQIGHNVRIGAYTAIAGCTGIAGSARIGSHCMIGGSVNIMGHIEIVDGVTVSACTFVSRSILKPGHYSGSWPFEQNASWEKNAATLRNLYALRERVRDLEKKIE